MGFLAAQFAFGIAALSSVSLLSLVSSLSSVSLFPILLSSVFIPPVVGDTKSGMLVPVDSYPSEMGGGQIFIDKSQVKSNLAFIGDVHGNYAELDILIRKLDSQYGEDYTAVFLGDLVHSGNYSMDVLRFVRDRMILSNKDGVYRTLCIKGNHEVNVVDALDKTGRFQDETAYETWVNKGVDRIHVQSELAKDRTGLKDWVRSLPHIITFDWDNWSGSAVHAGLLPNSPIAAAALGGVTVTMLEEDDAHEDEHDEHEAVDHDHDERDNEKQEDGEHEEQQKHNKHGKKFDATPDGESDTGFESNTKFQEVVLRAQEKNNTDDTPANSEVNGKPSKKQTKKHSKQAKKSKGSSENKERDNSCSSSEEEDPPKSPKPESTAGELHEEKNAPVQHVEGPPKFSKPKSTAGEFDTNAETEFSVQAQSEYDLVNIREVFVEHGTGRCYGASKPELKAMRKAKQKVRVNPDSGKTESIYFWGEVYNGNVILNKKPQNSGPKAISGLVDTMTLADLNMVEKLAAQQVNGSSTIALSMDVNMDSMYLSGKTNDVSMDPSRNVQLNVVTNAISSAFDSVENDIENVVDDVKSAFTDMGTSVENIPADVENIPSAVERDIPFVSPPGVPPMPSTIIHRSGEFIERSGHEIIFGHYAHATYQAHPFATGIDTNCKGGGYLTAMIVDVNAGNDIGNSIHHSGKSIDEIRSARQFIQVQSANPTPKGQKKAKITEPNVLIIHCDTDDCKTEKATETEFQSGKNSGKKTGQKTRRANKEVVLKATRAKKGVASDGL